MKKSLALFFAFLILCQGMFLSCTSNKTTVNDNNNLLSDEADGDGSFGDRIAPDIPKSDFEGYKFTILVNSCSETNVNLNDFHAEEITSVAINDAIYNRRLKVESMLNVLIEDVETTNAEFSDAKEYIVTDVKAGTGAYDLASIAGYAASLLSQENYLVDLKTVPYINLDAQWWDQTANRDLTILDQLFFTTGEITTSDNDATYCILFNKQIREDNNLENPYELVNSGKWTIDKFIEMASKISGDLDGNGKFDENDRYGALIWDDTMMGIINASEEKCVTIDDEGLLELTLNTEKTINVIEKFLNFAENDKVALPYQRIEYTDTLLINMFSQDQALFVTQLIKTAPKLRDMDTNFGILPFFKYDETQNKYYSPISSFFSVFICVPNSQKDVTRTGIVTEALANESLYGGLTEAYYDRTLKGITTRDRESQEMLDIIFANRIYDLGWFYGVGGYHEAVMNMLRNKNNNFASMYKSTLRYATRAVQLINDTYTDSKMVREMAEAAAKDQQK